VNGKAAEGKPITIKAGAGYKKFMMDSIRSSLVARTKQ
jgi:hypothetical protein